MDSWFIISYACWWAQETNRARKRNYMAKKINSGPTGGLNLREVHAPSPNLPCFSSKTRKRRKFLKQLNSVDFPVKIQLTSLTRMNNNSSKSSSYSLPFLPLHLLHHIFLTTPHFYFTGAVLLIFLPSYHQSIQVSTL